MVNDSKDNASPAEGGQHPTTGGEDLLPAQAPRPEDPQTPAYLVGIGSSAGGLEALELFLESVPASTRAAYVIIQHMSPDFKSVLSELLSRFTELPIRQAEDGEPLAAGHVYLIPPGKVLSVEENRLHLGERPAPRTQITVIDTFFKSLAREYKERAVAVVLSGTGSDGAEGVKAVREAGGIAFAQDSESAKFDSMPRMAVETGAVDFVLHPSEIPGRIGELAGEGGETMPGARTGEDGPTQGTLSKICKLLEDASGIDFVNYKKPTLTRRIERRIMITGCEDSAAYLELIREDPAELNLLVKDLLIGVTSFFRDPEAFTLVEEQAIARLVREHAGERELRAWSVGCASGEEAYSLAILFFEQAEKAGKKLKLKIFATDVHSGAIETAAAGIYTAEALANVSPELVEKYFVREQAGLRIRSDLRESVVVARHNILNDPPFTRIDLISCRNLLIYFENETQLRALSLFYFALQPDAFLFIGRSESLGPLAESFAEVHGKARLFRKLGEKPAPMLPHHGQPRGNRLLRQSPRRSGRGHGRALASLPDVELQHAYDTLLEMNMPPGLLITHNRELKHVFGDASRYLSRPAGRYDADVLNLVEGELRIALSTAIPRVLNTRQATIMRSVDASNGKGGEKLTVKAVPLPSRGEQEGYVCITFEPHEDTRILEASEEVKLDEAVQRRIRDLERDLAFTKENLRLTVQELEASNEELQATNEEMLASNEELQSTNEELHSVNEELYTVNTEYESKIRELTETTNDLDNFLKSTRIATVFLDKDLRVRNFTPAISATFNLIPKDIGRPIEHFAYSIVGHDTFIEDIRRATTQGESTSREVNDKQGRHLLLRVLPYLTKDEDIEGAVLTFTDITEQKETELKLREMTDSLQRETGFRASLLRALGDGLLATGADGLVTFINPVAQELLMPEGGEATGRPWHELFDIHDCQTGQRIPPEHLPVTKALQGTTVADERLCNCRAARKDRGVHLGVTATPILNADGSPKGAVCLLRDVTARVRHEEREREITRRNEALVEAFGDIVFDYDGAQDTYTWSGAHKAILGFSAAQMPKTYREFIERLHPEDRDPYEQARRQAVARETRFHQRFRMRDAQGGWHWLQARARIFLDEQSADLAKLVGVFEDAELFRQKEAAAERALANLEASQSYLTGIIEGSHDLICAVDPDYRILIINSAARESARKLYGVELAVGRNFVEAFQEHPRHQERLRALWNRGLAGEEFTQIADFQSGEGDTVTFESSFSCIRNQDGQLLGTCQTARDITERHRIEQELAAYREKLEHLVEERTRGLIDTNHKLHNEIEVRRQAEANARELAHQAEHANNAKSNFLAMMSHEIRTPMNAVIGFAELLSETGLDEDQRNYLERILRGSESLLVILNDILDYTRLDTARLDIAEEPVCFAEEINKAVSLLELKARDKRLTLDCEISDSFPERVLGDGTRFRQVVVNLLHNAIKFTDEGTVTINASGQWEPRPAHWKLHFRVQDTGVGIEPEKQKQIFNAFTQADPDLAREEKMRRPRPRHRQTHHRTHGR